MRGNIVFNHGYFYTIRRGSWYNKLSYATAETTCQHYSMTNIGNGYSKRLYRIVNGRRKLLDKEES